MIPEHEDDLAVLLHVYRLGSVYLDLLGQLGLPATQRMAAGGVDGAAFAANSITAALDQEFRMGSPRQIQQALAALLFEEDAED
ncbi:MAG TPA: hypothetical protein VKF59_15255 [Candidatus Dormibacteraeota bacterium]|nr:hypothetical protein [Candidatus Dormibacteraeota bacterium]